MTLDVSYPRPPSPTLFAKVIFAMTGELVKFGVVMLVVMSGFVMSFYSLFRDTDTYGEVSGFFLAC